MAGVADEALAVDRVALRDGPKHISVWRIGQLVLEVQEEEVRLRHRPAQPLGDEPARLPLGRGQALYARRPGRSLDYLANFRPAPPVEDRKKHATERYLDVLAPLGVGEVSRVPRLPVREEDARAVAEMLRKAKAESSGADSPVGIFPGAGHPSRRWPDRALRATRLDVRAQRLRPHVLFAGPEERALVRDARKQFPPSTVVLDKLTVQQLAAAAAPLSVFVSNDTGPMHVAAAVGTPVVILMQHHPMFNCYIPVGERHRVVAASHHRSHHGRGRLRRRALRLQHRARHLALRLNARPNTPQ
jgi:ADP-heptose:LPS heptosyltransferase